VSSILFAVPALDLLRLAGYQPTARERLW